jgi:hypothetical protein
MNLLFPAAIGLVMILVLTGLIVTLLVPPAGLLLSLAWKAADLLLKIPGEMPAYFDFYLRAPGVPPLCLAVGGGLLLVIAAHRHEGTEGVIKTSAPGRALSVPQESSELHGEIAGAHHVPQRERTWR